MGIVRKYFFYKRFLQITFFVNAVFVSVGLVATIRFFQNHDVTSLNLGVIGGGIFVFGLLVPWLVLDRFVDAANEARKQTEETVARLVSGWIENYNDHDGIENAEFWMNMSLLVVETVAENSSHPVARLLGEFAPMLKKELKNSGKKKSRKVS